MKRKRGVAGRGRGGTGQAGGLNKNLSEQEAVRRACLSLLDFEDVPEERDLPTGLRKALAFSREGKEK